MTPEYAQGIVNSIKRGAGDAESAHSLEDELYAAFVRWVATDAQVPASVKDVAAILLTTESIDFPRWCA